ncbi:hypothetical protein CMV30_11310 [Nibricoccus aquaticus]|uniref:Band 7 domain-containing protein n=1 Tax=Nibricoccus aquaticus TaxID=2576891 RepID=A0A290Q7L8_9BACT|nr:protease modulator HflK [Nibricoccus aquaticus]ATC64494.1 hypothetical protein CMV30_11310 [Nibricoccus aquaticus]
MSTTTTHTPTTRRRQSDGLLMEALLHTLRNLTPIAQGLCLVLLAVYLFSGFRFIGPGRSALILRLGQLQPEVHGPGFLAAWPAPIDEVVLLETGAEHALLIDNWTSRGPRLENVTHLQQFTDAQIQSQLEATGTAPVPVEIAVAGDSLDPVTDGYSITGDLNILQGHFALRYRIADPHAFFHHGPAAVETLLKKLSLRAASRLLSESAIDDLVTSGREKLATAIRNELEAGIAHLKLGVSATALEIRELVPPRQVAAAFEDVTSARLFARTLEENAAEYRLKQLAIVRGQASAIQQRADSTARQSIAASQGESAAFTHLRAEYMRAPALVRTRLYNDTLDTVMQQVNSSTLLPPGATPPSVFLEPSASR